MDFSKLLQHCRDEHGVEVSTSVLMKELFITIFRHFDRKHGLILHDTEIWDVLEQLQNQPKPGCPPPIVATIKKRAYDNIKCDEPMDGRSFASQSGVLLSNREALELVEFCDRANVPEQLPDYGTGFRPPWDLIAPEYVACAVDENGSIFLYVGNPEIFTDQWNLLLDCSPYQIAECHQYPFALKAPVKNWRECLWIRPGHREKEGAE